MKTIKVLFVEDEMLLRTLFEDAIIGYKEEYAGYDFLPEAVSDLRSAMDYLDSDKTPDVIILDLRLPSGDSGATEVPEKENGFAILRKIKSSERLKSIPVIVFTNLSDEATKHESLSLGADGFLVKSKVLPVDLLGEIARVSEK